MSSPPCLFCGRATYNNNPFRESEPDWLCDLCSKHAWYCKSERHRQDRCACSLLPKLSDLPGETWVHDGVVFYGGKTKWNSDVHPFHKAHGALLRVSKDGIYRCPECHVGCQILESV